MGTNCGYCVKAKNLFQKEITAGEIIELPASQAPKNVTGFPYFSNPSNGLSHTGYPGDKQTLYNKLQYTPKQTQVSQVVSENYCARTQNYIAPRNYIAPTNYGAQNYSENFLGPCDIKNKYVNFVNNIPNNSIVKIPGFTGLKPQYIVNSPYYSYYSYMNLSNLPDSLIVELQKYIPKGTSLPADLFNELKKVVPGGTLPPSLVEQIQKAIPGTLPPSLIDELNRVPSLTPCPSDTFNFSNFICSNCNLSK